MKGVHFLTDDKNNPVAVQIDLKKHKNLWEDFYGLMIAKERRNEQSRSYMDIRKELKLKNQK